MRLCLRLQVFHIRRPGFAQEKGTPAFTDDIHVNRSVAQKAPADLKPPEKTIGLLQGRFVRFGQEIAPDTRAQLRLDPVRRIGRPQGAELRQHFDIL
jgi:hypothetical protein